MRPKIWIVVKVDWSYVDDYHFAGNVITGSWPIAAFTLQELAEEHANELNVKYFRERDIDFMDYSPYEGWDVFKGIKAIREILKLEKKIMDGNLIADYLTKNIKSLSDEQILKISEIAGIYFYAYREVELYA